MLALPDRNDPAERNFGCRNRMIQTLSFKVSKSGFFDPYKGFTYVIVEN